MLKKQVGFAHPLLLLLVVTVLAVVGFAGWKVFEKQAGYSPLHLATGKSTDDKAQAAGKQLSNGECSGNGPGKLTHSAMDPTDFLYIIPYGLMVGGHVTPIDHQYYSVKRDSARDAYPVYAMGDAKIVDIEHRTNSPGDNKQVQTRKTDEYRLVFSQSCTFFYYYDLLTSLDPTIKAKFDAVSNGGFSAKVNIPVKAGDIIGRIGGQTLDFAIWNTQKQLAGFVLPDHYKEELWKIYVADPLDYYSSELKTLMLSRYPRVDEPLSGRLDWDIDGKLRGNWFIQGTGYEDRKSSAPWSNELSFAPDLYDPSRFIISIGDFGADLNNTGVNAQQFYVVGNTPDPASVSQDSGLVKYQLTSGDYFTPGGQMWDRESFIKGLKIQVEGRVSGVVLIQMTDGRTLKFEAFPNKTAAQVSGFDSLAKIYTR